MKIVVALLRVFPFLNSRTVERLMLWLASGRLPRLIADFEFAELKRLTRLEKILVIADANIGDSILTKPAVTALRRRLPETAVDYAYHHKARQLIQADPDIRRSYPVLQGGTTGHPGNRRRLREIVEANRYDLIVSLAPLLTRRDLRFARCPVLCPVALVAGVFRAYRRREVAFVSRHVVAWVDRMVAVLPARLRPETRDEELVGTSIFVSARHLENADAFLRRSGITDDDRVVFLNPDTSNPSTFLGAGFFAPVIRRLLASREVDSVLLGGGLTFPGVEHRILERLDDLHREGVVLVPPDLSLGDLAAVVDRCHVYIGGDTGPLHIAAARKTLPGSENGFRNTTTIVSLFKATDPRIYGYDSFTRGMAAASQDAAARVFEGRPSCKNLTCSVQRITATCPAMDCEKSVSPESVSRFVISTLRERRVPQLHLGRRGHSPVATTADRAASMIDSGPTADRAP